MKIIYSSITEVKQALLIDKSISCIDIVKQYLKNIEAENNELNILLEVFETDALNQAKSIDAKIKNVENVGVLAGVVIVLKDNIVYKNHKVSASSKILENYTSIYSATVVERLLQADAIIIGRANCDEFAMGSSNENSAFGGVKNPLDSSKVPGGSSGGSAAAVAAGFCLASLGTDTGGSIRQPASFCGLVGLKPTYGRVSRYGAIAYASSFDQIGPITLNVEDNALITQVIAGYDDNDATTSSVKVGNYNILSEKKYSIAVLKSCIENNALDPQLKKNIETTLEQLTSLGHKIRYVDFNYLEYLVPTYYVLTTAEASSNLARYDGIRYGYRSKNATDLESTYILSRSEGFGKEVKRRIMLGTFVLSAGYYNAYYGKAQRVRRLIKNEIESILSNNDFILTPTTPGTAFAFNAKKDPIAMYLEDIFTVLANIVGLPAITTPLQTSKDAMPYGIQLMGKAFDENNLFNAAQQLYTINKSELINSL